MRQLLCSVIVVLAPIVLAANPFSVYQFDDPELERRYHELNAELRCPKCLSTNIAGSDSMISQDLRRTVYRLLTVERLSDDEIRTYMQDRYGDFILYDTPFTYNTWLIWVLPFVLGGMIIWILKHRLSAARRSGSSLDPELKRQIDSILDEQTQ